MTGILIYVEAACIIIGRFLILYAVFCLAKAFWKQFRHAANKIYSHVTGDAESLFPKKQCICQVRKSEMAEMMSKKVRKVLCTKKAFLEKMMIRLFWSLKNFRFGPLKRLALAVLFLRGFFNFFGSFLFC